MLLMNCRSHKNINRLADSLVCEKPIEFIFDKYSNVVKIEKVGPYIGESKIPDYELSFIKAVNELNKIVDGQLSVSNARGLPSDDIIKAEITITRILWEFTEVDATMSTDMVFKSNGEKVKITGKNVVYVHGTKKGNLWKSLKDGIYQYIYLNCNDKKFKQSF